MNNYSKLYWLTRLDSITNLLGSIGIFLMIAAIVVGVAAFVFGPIEWDDDEIKIKQAGAKKWMVWMCSIACFVFTINAFIPTKNEAILIMVGGKTLDFVGNDSSLNKIPAQTTKIISDYLDNAIKEVKEDAAD